MRILTLAIAAAATLTSAGFASAADKISDSQFLAAARCTGLAEGSGQSAESFQTYLKAQSKGRTGNIYDRADKLRAQARHSAKIADETQKGVYERELSGVCAAYANG